MTPIAVSFGVSLVACMWIVHRGRTTRATLDHDLEGPQKVHFTPVPRVGGAGVMAGLAAGVAVLLWMGRPSGPLGLALLACSLPALAAGLLEDLTKTVRPLWRLLATALSALAAALWLGTVIPDTGIPGLDTLAATTAGSILLAVFAVSGVAHSINLIDGMNGLASMCVVLMLGALGYVAMEVGDLPVTTLSLLCAAAIIGFFIWNFPAGLIFLGDGGAYLIGFLYAEIALLLLVRHPGEVSPLFPLLVCIYPVFETVFSIYRRKVLRGSAVGEPDAIHLHTLVYRRVMRWVVPGAEGRALTRRNSMTSPFMWLLCSLSIFPALIFWDDTLMLSIMLLLFVLSYLVLYWRIVRFKVPRWLG